MSLLLWFASLYIWSELTPDNEASLRATTSCLCQTELQIRWLDSAPSPLLQPAVASHHLQANETNPNLAVMGLVFMLNLKQIQFVWGLLLSSLATLVSIFISESKQLRLITLGYGFGVLYLLSTNSWSSSERSFQPFSNPIYGFNVGSESKFNMFFLGLSILLGSGNPNCTDPKI